MTKITQDFYQAKSKRTIKGLLMLFALFLMSTQMSWGQAQVLGAFKEIDGGFEGQANGAIAPVSLYGAVANVWTTQGAGAFPATITEDAAIARSGKKSYVYTATGGAKYNYSPLLVNNPFVTSTATKYTIQFYNKHTTGTDAVANILQKMAHTGSGTAANIDRFFGAGTSVSYAMNTWVKTYFTFTTSTASAAGTNCAGVRSIGPGTGVTIGGVVDDYVVYAGDLDTVLPDAPTTPVVAVASATTLNVGWTAPVTGVDGGGYMVVRYATSPNADNDPNLGGIYAVGNTTTNGTGSLTGTVVYVGTSTSFVDTVADSSVHYYYKIYTVDKAFNYSAEITGTAPLSSTTWDGTVWSNGTPDSTLEAIIDGDYSTTTNGTISAKKLTVNATKTLTINSGTNVTVQNELINNGSVIVESNANLVQVNNVTNTGNITVNRNSNALYRLDYTMWSSPVTGTQTLSDFSPLTATSRFYEYNSATDLYNTIANTGTFGSGKGYLIRMPNENPSDLGTGTTYYLGTSTLTYNGVFTGVPNNGNVSVTMSTAGNGYNAVGNPYPSAINIDTFISANAANINGTLWFWRKKNDALNATSYSTCTSIGCTLVNGAAYPNDNNVSVGQGFIVKASTTTLDFTNAMREGNNTNQFFKIKKVVVDKNRIWLNLVNNTNVVSQALVAYVDGATQGLDAGIDGKYINDSPVALTSNINNEEYTIQGRPAFDPSDVVPLNFKTDAAGNYTIAIDHAEGLFAEGQDVILVDNTTGTETDLTAGTYTFTATAGTDNARFALKYQKTLGTNKSVFSDNNVTVYKNKGTLFVNAGDMVITNIKVYDVLGKLLTELKNVKATSATIANLKATSQVLVVKITSQDNKVVTKKVVN